MAVPRSISAALLLAASCPAIAQERRITVPDLSEPADRERFRAVFTRTCDRAPDIREQQETTSRQERGTILGQTPPAGSVIPCSQSIFVIRVAAPPSPQREPGPDRSPTAPGAGQQILEDLLEGLANPPPPRTLTVPDLAPSGALEAFEAETRNSCNRRLTVRDETEENSAPPGTIIAQRPPAGATLSCRRPAVTLTRSLGPPAPPPMPPPGPPPALFVPALLTPAARETFAAAATRFCDTPLSITLRRRETDGPAGRFLAQSPAQGTPYRCGTPVSVTLSAVRPAPPPPPARQPLPEPAPIPRDPAPVPPEPVPPEPTPLPPEPLPVPPEPATAPTAAEDRPPPISPTPDSTPAPTPPSPPPPKSQLPLAALIAAAVALLGGGFLAGRLLARRTPTPEPGHPAGPQPGIRRGTPRITSTLDAPPDPAGPALGLTWRRPTVRTEAAPAIAREEIDHG